jgi:D-3-phosphoglycerate dehydrogenase
MLTNVIVGEAEMGDNVDALILDLIEWIGPHSRPYAEVMEAWRTSCPRLPVWEEANARGFLARSHEPGRGARIAVTESGRRFLRERRGTTTASR